MRAFRDRYRVYPALRTRVEMRCDVRCGLYVTTPGSRPSGACKAVSRAVVRGAMRRVSRYVWMRLRFSVQRRRRDFYAFGERERLLARLEHGEITLAPLSPMAACRHSCSG